MAARVEQSKTAVYFEVGQKRIFACAYDWPGLCRAGRDEAAALAALTDALPRYAAVAKAAGTGAPSDRFDVVERLTGSATTDFGAPGAIPQRDHEPLTNAEAKRIAALVSAAWDVLDQITAGAPLELTKGPRGGGRDRDKIVDHVLAAESGYLASLGVRGRKQPARDDRQAVHEHRQIIFDALQMEQKGRWPPAYGARRIAWHALDHAWEIENRIPPGISASR